MSLILKWNSISLFRFPWQTKHWGVLLFLMGVTFCYNSQCFHDLPMLHLSFIWTILWKFFKQLKLQPSSIFTRRISSLAQWLEEPPIDWKVVCSRLTESIIGCRQEKLNHSRFNLKKNESKIARNVASIRFILEAKNTRSRNLSSEILWSFSSS